MDQPTLLPPPFLRFPPKDSSRSPSRSPTRPRITDDILSDLSPAVALEQFTSASGALKSSIEAATPTQRAFGIRAAIASKKIQEWVTELSAWPWPEGTAAGFESPLAKRRKINQHSKSSYTTPIEPPQPIPTGEEDDVYWGSLPESTLLQYELRIDEISEDMEDLDVEEIKGQVLNTHLQSRSRPSSSHVAQPAPTMAAYTKMDDFTAVITATVLQALPNLSRLMRLMDVWSVRLSILREVPTVLSALDDVEIALRSGWEALEQGNKSQNDEKDFEFDTTPSVTRETFENIRARLQERVTHLGQRLDQMLDTLVGREDTIPESWLDRMEAIEQDYGEWVVYGDRMVSEGEWAKAKAEQERLHRIEEERLRKEEENRLRRQEEEEQFRREEEERIYKEKEARIRRAEDERLRREASEKLRKEEEEKLFNEEQEQLRREEEDRSLRDQVRRAEEQRILEEEQERLRKEEERLRSEQERDRLVEEGRVRRVEQDKLREAEEAGLRQIEEERVRLEHEKSQAVEEQRLLAEKEQLRRQEEDKLLEKEKLRRHEEERLLEKEKLRREEEQNLWLEQREIAAQKLEQVRREAEELRRLAAEAEKRQAEQEKARLESLSPLADTSTKLSAVFKAMPPRAAPEIPLDTVEEKDTSKLLDADRGPIDTTTASTGPEPIITKDVFLSMPMPPKKDENNGGKGHSRMSSYTSTVTGYAASDPSPEIYEAETEYFKPLQSSPRLGMDQEPDLSTPKEVSLDMAHTESFETSEKDQMLAHPVISDSYGEHRTLDILSEDAELETPQPSSQSPRRSSIISNRVSSPVLKEIVIRRRSSTSSTSTIVREGPHDIVMTPPKMSSPGLGRTPGSPLIADDMSTRLHPNEESPSIGWPRIYHRDDSYSPPSSPSTALAPTELHPLKVSTGTARDKDSLPPDSPTTPLEPPFLDNLDVSPVAHLPSPAKTSEDQLQQQISEILETIPAKIRLTSEPELEPQNLQVRKRRSLTAAFRPLSRASTPSFTLAPAHRKNPRPRPQNGHPEIKLYHLSRSTGEAPIKLFVRLVGENGERVMVRVGGGWADLGAYLKEYASHHGRRNDKDGKVEVQDMSPRVGSTGSMSSFGFGNGRSSPSSRPGSSLERRPSSSLAIRKTRRSVEEDGRQQAPRSPRSPTTPLSFTSTTLRALGPNDFSSPPSASSATSRSSSLSWAPENGARADENELGLAGPKGKRVEMSAENAAWVESMKEKVRQASAEKEKRTDFGSLGKVGGTKRLFRKSLQD